MPRLKAKMLLLLSLATFSASVFAQNTVSARPGTLNYVEGQASVQGRQVDPGSVSNTTLQTGEVLSTANGKTEVLLTPGVFMRLGENSSAQMVSTNLTRTEVRLDRGQANVEVDQIYKQNTILIDLPSGQTQLLKNGLYTFDVENSTVRVFNGQADVFPGNDLQAAVKPIVLKGSHQFLLTGDGGKPQRFDKDKAQDDLYKWSSLRSQYLGTANLNLASEYAGTSGFYPGWYWAGGPYGYTWLPGNGLLWNPYGYGFYSPYYIYGGGPIYGSSRGFYGYRGRPFGAVGGYANGFHGNAGGFHGAGGGFHGGSGGGHR
jgi:hypothetical protein